MSLDFEKHPVDINNSLKIFHKEVLDTSKNIIDLLTNITEYRDTGSGRHARRTKDLMEILVFELLRDPKFSYELEKMDYKKVIRSTPLHDVGKIAIPDRILLKKGKLSINEMQIIKYHPLVGSEIIESVKSCIDDTYFNCCHDICLYHHESWDGSGYPYGLSGKEIPLSARILSVVDSYDALTSERPYKKAYSHESAINIIEKEKGLKFDPDILNVFLEFSNKFSYGINYLGM